MTQHHYHAELEGCGHTIGFDVDVDLLEVTVEAGGDDLVVVLPCATCGGTERRTVEGSVMPGGRDVSHCVTCKKGFGS